NIHSLTLVATNQHPLGRVRSYERERVEAAKSGSIRGGSPKVIAVLFQQACELGIERRTTEIFRHNISMGVDQVSRRNAGHAIFLAQFVLPTFAVEILRPAYGFFFNETLQRALALIEADADDLESFRMIFSVR